MSVSVNPRRRTPVTRPESPAGLSLKTNMTLRKDDALASPPSLRRSQTNLDDVVDAHCRRAALMIDDIENSLSNITIVSPKARSFRDDSLPVPRGFLNLPVVDPAMAKEKSKEAERRILRPRTRRSSRHHESDSGLGTSVAPTTETEPATTASKKASAITRSAAATSSSTKENLRGLSQKAANRITEHILRPLRAKPALKDFEPIVLDVPRLIRDKEIICLRDLEKTLIFMAPGRSKTAALYLDFCLTSIRCIQATVEYLSDREQTRPNDRPYTNGYFIDLVEQLHQYAGQLAAAKEKGDVEISYGNPAPGLFAPANATNSTDEIKLYGGITENGRPAELVRVRKDGKAISMATGLEVDLDDSAPIKMKRSMSQQLEDEEEIMRSMARRKKNASRPQEHEKTHSRPWKCPVSTCKYHEYGWPTEKEMDRHHNDKHSSAPPMYECLYKPCPYKSKRESNCKQHMEKAHGWTYVRTKTNGKKDSKAGSAQHFNFNDPMLPLHPIGPVGDFASHIDGMEFPSYISDEEFEQVIGVQQPFDNQVDLEMSLSPSDHNTPNTDISLGPYSYQDGPEFIVEDDIYAAHASLPTPDRAVFADKQMNMAFPIYQPVPACQPQMMPAQPAPHISPIGQGNAMLFTPNSLAEVDESFDDNFGNAGDNFCGNDFQLFPSNNATKAFEPLFGEVPSAGLGYSQNSQDPFQSLDWNNIDYTNFPSQ
uniref:Zinc finger transcription factor ace1 n=1 Tax=Colletotrichum fructicola (strain Nara gc5) TaxID=1213859 RepID=L2G3Q1_COLFN